MVFSTEGEKRSMPTTSPQLLAWETLKVQSVAEFPPWFSVLRDSVRLPSGRIVSDYYRIEAPDYALVCARQQEAKILLERHYKQCLGRFILTLPAGGIEGGGETPLLAAQRELLEETGFQAARWREGGSFTVDGTRGICRAHFFYADQLEQIATPCNHDMEEFELVFYDRREIAGAIRDGTICLLPDIALLSMAFSTLFNEGSD
jgi:ADP-ribose pyrophosphatase